MNTGDVELISKTIDEVVEPDVLIRTPSPVDATGVQAVKEVFGRLRRAFPDLHVTVEDLIAEGDKVVGHSEHGVRRGDHQRADDRDPRPGDGHGHRRSARRCPCQDPRTGR
jgi:hypothetical protein